MNKSAEDYLNELPYRITRTIERKCPHCKKLCLKLKYSMNLFWICPHLNIKFSEWLPEVYRVMKSGTHIYFMINSRNYKDLQIEAEKAGFIYQNTLVWVKQNATPNRYYMQKCEFILMLRKGNAKYINNLGAANVFTDLNPTGNKFHPTEKPVSLMKKLIENSTNEGDIVLEPFAGAWSTLLAAKETGRNYVGSELDKKYYDIALERLQGTAQRTGSTGQISLFMRYSGDKCGITQKCFNKRI